MRTISGTEPTRAVPTRASRVTSPLLTLGRPNLPATKIRAEAPLIGSGTVTLLENVPVPERKTTAPPPATDLPVIRTLTVGEVAPDGSVTRIRQGEGAHDTKRLLRS